MNKERERESVCVREKERIVFERKMEIEAEIKRKA